MPAVAALDTCAQRFVGVRIGGSQTMTTRARFFLLAGFLFLSGCGGKPDVPKGITPAPPPPMSQQTPAASPIRFENVAQKAGLDFSLGHGGRSPLTILETSGGGCAFLDYDSDGWADILLVGPHRAALYHNERNGSFKNVTAQSGLAIDKYWMGCTVGDYDGDGRPDIVLTGYRCFALYRNLGGGKFQDVTRQSGLGGLEWSMSAAFADLSGSGRLDLFVGQYVQFDAKSNQICEVGPTRSACGPEVYSALSGKLFRNLGQGRFQAVPWKDTGKTWGVLASDLLGTGRPALYEANDMMPGDLWTRQGADWKNVGADNGTAYDGQGHMQGGMGVDSGDYRNEGRLSLVVTTYFAQPISLYHNDGNGLFTVTSGPSNLGPPTTQFVKFGVGFVDLDNDGWLDLMLTNGHVRDNVHDFDAAQTYAQPLQIFHNSQGQFADGSASSGIADLRAVGRGLAFADFDHDGKVDALVCNLEGPALLLHNVTPTANHWLDVRVQTSGGNRFGLGTLVTAKVGGLSMLREIRTNGSVLSAQDPVAHFGLGSAAGPVELSLRWPDGKTQRLTVSKIDTSLTITAP
jgi:hypothetical protein